MFGKSQIFSILIGNLNRMRGPDVEEEAIGGPGYIVLSSDVSASPPN